MGCILDDLKDLDSFFFDVFSEIFKLLGGIQRKFVNTANSRYALLRKLFHCWPKFLKEICYVTYGGNIFKF